MSRIINPLRALDCVVLIVLIMFFGGCSASLSDQDRARLSCVSIDPAVKIKGFTYFGGKGKACTVVGGILAGPVGAAAGSVAGADRPEKDQILNLMRKNNIDIGQIMTSELEKQLAVKPDFPTRVTADGDAQFHFEIGYALASGLFSGKLKPELYVWANLKDRNGKTLWKSYQWVNEGLNGYTHKEYMQNPESLREVFQEACAIVAKKLARKL
jgi:hypothetical protein